MTLTEFLLARIEEDEARARPMWELKVRQRIIGAPIVPLSWPTPDRVLAECEAKRRIVDMFPFEADGDGWNEAGAQVLPILALPYADHPDYRDEWRL
jgi:hypothetical protein